MPVSQRMPYDGPEAKVSTWKVMFSFRLYTELVSIHGASTSMSPVPWQGP